jgi:pyruvate,water dikinase
MYLVNQKSVEHYAKLNAGGKGYNLYLLKKLGLNVPEWIVFPPSLMDYFLECNKLKENIHTTLNAKELKLNEISKSIEDIFLNSSFDDVLIKKLQEARAHLPEGPLAIRSSATDEDSGGHSFAGQLSTFLYQETDQEIEESIKRCWASAWSERGLFYRQNNDLPVLDIKVAVVLQQMIDSDKSGVMFTCDPTGQKKNQILINSVYGIGEGLVSGALDADTSIIDRQNGALIGEETVNKDKKYVQDKDKKGLKEVDVHASLSQKACLSPSNIEKLWKMALEIEKFYGHAQDIEWAIYNDRVYLLQSRPVTTKHQQSTGELKVWDNSNIVESYGGITMPLTFGFARYVYHQVYVQFCEILMVPQKNIREMDPYLKNMLGLFYGRVYYNLLNWYKLTSILPGYKYNRGFMETMMGTDEELSQEIADKVRPPAFQETFSAFFRKFFTGTKFLYFHFTIQSLVDNFLTYFHKVYDHFRHQNYSHMPCDEIYRDYQLLEKQLLTRWHAPIINDFLCMIHYGIFKKLTEKWLSGLGEGFHNDLLAGNGSLESAAPTKRLIVLASKVEKNTDLKNLILSTSNSDLMEALNQSDFKEFYEDVVDYLDKYGFRCMSEMKLEQKDMHQDPSLFFVFIKNMVNGGQTDLDAYEKREKLVREQAEEKLKKSLKGTRVLVYRWSLRNARKAVRNRENTRFCRTRIYGVVRAMFYGMGEDLVRKGCIKKKEDVFFLSTEELFGSLEGTNSVLNLQKIVELRQQEYANYEESDEPDSRFITRGLVYVNNSHFSTPEINIDLSDLKENQLKGIGCCPGVVEGRARVVMGPDDNLELNNDILVAYRTDPGWIPLYPSASALLVERGGLLSHSAIVAREMGLPTVVSIQGLTKKIKDGDFLRIDGQSGLIEIIN